MPRNELGPMPTPSADSAELQPGGADAVDEEPTGLVRDIRSSIPTAPPAAPDAIDPLTEPSDR